MRTHRIIPGTTYHEPIPVIDEEFDRFELSHDLEVNRREAEATAFYHDTLDPEE